MKKEKLLTFCKKCLMPHTLPRQNFNTHGACEWNELKLSSIDWTSKFEIY